MSNSFATGDAYGFMYPRLAPKAWVPQSTLDLETQPINTMPAPLKPKPKPKTGAKSAQEWNVVKADIYQLYIIEDLALSHVMERMEREKTFIQSCKQYKTKLKEWGYEKNIKERDMKAIVRKDLKRKAENPIRPSTFRVRGRPVPQPKIDRYKRDLGLSEDLATIVNAATPSDISCETARALAESPGRALGGSYDPVPAPRPQSENVPFTEMDHETGTPPMHNLAKPRTSPSSTKIIDPTPTDHVEICTLRVMISYPSQASQSRDLKIGTVFDLSASMLDVHVSFGAGDSLRETYQYTPSPPLLLVKDVLVKHLPKYIRRSHFMFRLRHGPYSLSHDLFVSESTDQILALANELATGGRTDHTAWTEQPISTGNISETPELLPPLPMNKETAGSTPQLSLSCQVKSEQFKMTVRDHHACCGGKCNAIPKRRIYWYCCYCNDGPKYWSLVKNCSSCEHVRCCTCEIVKRLYEPGDSSIFEHL